MKKVLMIACAFPPLFPAGFSIRVVKFIKYLPALGWLPVVLTMDDKKEYETGRKVGSESLLKEIQPQVKIYRTTAGEPSLTYLEKERRFGQQNWLTRSIVKVLGGSRRWAFRTIFLPDRHIAWLPFALQRGRHIVKKEAIDVIFATCPPYSATLIGACLKRLTGKPLILDFRDDWIDTPWYLARPAVNRLIDRRLENWVVKTADKVILVTEWSRDAFLARYPAQPGNKFLFISNGCDLGEFTALHSKPAVSRNSKFTIVHAGSLNASKNWGRSPEGLLHAIHNLVRQNPEMAERLRLLFAGDFPEEYERLTRELGLCGVIQGIGHMPHKEVLELIQSADLLLAMNYDGWATLIPGKIYEYWAVGGPPILLLSCPGAAATFVEQHHLGRTVEPFDVGGIQQAILSVYQQSKTTAPLHVSTAGIEAYDRRALTCRLAEALSMA